MDDSVGNGKPTLPTISISTRPHAPPVIRASLGERVVYEDSGDPSAKRFRRQFVADLAGVMGAKPGDLKLLDPAILDAARQAMDDRPPMPTPVNAGALMVEYPHLREPVVGGIARRGETINIIAAPKMGKSWLAYGLAWSCAAGLDWLGRFPCTAGKVLLIDNELHPETLAHRLKKVAVELGVDKPKYHDRVDVLSLRGRLADLPQICRWLDAIQPGEYSVVALDSLYRSFPEGMSESDNAQVTSLYNCIDAATGRLEACWANVHHSSKGSQTEKAVTDVGSGAGSQSRAADTHIVLRPHEDDGCVVLEAAVRSWAPVEPLGLRWEFPLWWPDTGIDPAALKGRKTKAEERQSEKDEAAMQKIRDSIPQGEMVSHRKLRDETGWGNDRLNRIIALLKEREEIEESEGEYRGKPVRMFAMPF
ncbi:MAG: helicase RepA family protein [Planctomycetes bacterium]|nr:helicase RepA family protein [Planctomycetota bacterium]